MKFTETSFTNRTEVLKFPDHYVALPVMVSDDGIVANADGKKIVPAGTIVGGVGAPVLDDDTQPVEEKNSQGVVDGDPNAAVDAEGVLLNDVDVTHGNAPGAMVIHGYFALDKLPAAPADEAETALASRILFIK